MKKLLAALAFTLPSLSQAAIIYTDEALFLADYENPTKQIDFYTATSARAPSETTGNIDNLYSDSFSDEIFFETRWISDLSSAWSAVNRLHTGGPIFATDLTFREGERIGAWSKYSSVVAFHTSAGFFGWVPELNGSDVADTLFLFPIGAAIDSVEWGFTAKPVEAPEPAPALLLIAGLLAASLRTIKKRLY